MPHAEETTLPMIVSSLRRCAYVKVTDAIAAVNEAFELGRASRELPEQKQTTSYERFRAAVQALKEGAKSKTHFQGAPTTSVLPPIGCRACGAERPDNGDRCPRCGDDPDGYLQGAR